MRHLNCLPAEEAAALLRACCASSRWIDRMLSQRPFKSPDELFESAERIWNDLGREDWLEAFAAHPRIGGAEERRGEGADGRTGHGERGEAWSKVEQAGVAAATDDVKARLAQANREYEAKFGWIYIVCATGKSADEMLALATARMGNAPDAELRAAAVEQAKITRLRLAKLLADHS